MTAAPVNPTKVSLITRGAHRVLRDMPAAEAAENFEDAEIVAESRACWLGDRPIAQRTINQLLHLCLLRDVGEPGQDVERYVLNEEGRAMANDRFYTPMIVAILRKRQAANSEPSPSRHELGRKPSSFEA